jgi:iron complex transport system substrate-binding protein
MSQKFFKVFALLLIASMLLASCANAAVEPAAEEPAPAEVAEETAGEAEEVIDTSVVVVDGLGREVMFDAPPERIVITGKAWMLMVNAVYAFPEAKDRLVGISTTKQGVADFLEVVDPNLENKTRLENDAAAEQIAALQADAVILKSFLAESVGKSIEELGIPVIYLNLETPEQYTDDIATLGQLFADEERAQELIDFMNMPLGYIEEATADLAEEDKTNVLVVAYYETDGEVAFKVPSSSYMQTIMVELAGGNPIWKDIELGSGMTQVNLEQVAAWDAEKVFVISYYEPVNEVIEKLKADPAWQELQAIQNDEIYGFPTDYISWDQPDTRWILGYTWLASKLYPERMADFDIEQFVLDFYQTYYQFDPEFTQAEIIPTIVGNYP